MRPLIWPFPLISALYPHVSVSVLKLLPFWHPSVLSPSKWEQATIDAGMNTSCLFHTGQSVLDLACRWYWLFFCGGCAGEEGCLCPKVRQLSWGRPRLRPRLTGSAPGGRAGVWMSGFFNQPRCSFSGSTWCSHFPVCMCVSVCMRVCLAWRATALISGPQTPDTSDSIILIHLLT